MARLRPAINYTRGDDIQPSNLNKQAVEDYARKVAEVAGFHVGDDLSKLVDELAGRIHYQDLDDWIGEDGSIFVHGPFDFDIYLPHYTSPLRDRFTIGHELGHFFLHANQGDRPIIAYRSGSTRIEWEANWFAASLLMPRNEFARIVREECNDNVFLARHFGVSVDAARVRKESLRG